MPREVKQFICGACSKGHAVTIEVDSGEVTLLTKVKLVEVPLSYWCPITKMYRDYILRVPEFDKERYENAQIVGRTKVLSKKIEEGKRD